MVKYTDKNTPSLFNHVLRGHANELTILLVFLEILKTSHPDNAYDLSTDDDSRNRRKVDDVSVGRRL